MKTSWDLTHLYVSIDGWEKEFIILEEKLAKLKDLSNECINEKEAFINFLDFKSEVYLIIEKLYCYMNRHLDLDSTLTDYRKNLDKVLALYNDFQKIDNEFESNVITNSELVKQYLKDNRLKTYTRYLYRILRRKDHIISAYDGENYCNYTNAIHGIKSDYQALFSNDIKFKNVIVNGEARELNRTNYNDLILSKKQKDRKTIFNTYTEAYKNAIDLIADLYIKKLKNDIKIASLENYSSLLEKKLFALELPSEIINELIKTINNNLDVMHNYIDLKKKITGLHEYHLYDTSISICEIPKLEIELEDAIKIIKDSLAILGSDYIDIIEKMFEEGWIDVYPKDNKRTMSFTCISYVGVPYILINYIKSIDSVRTLGHEIGHGVHTYLSKMNNDFINFEFSMFLTEIASKVNELLIFEYMLKNNNNKEEEKYILNGIISNLGNSLFGQIMLTEFEHTVINDISDGKPIDSDYLNELYLKISKKYNGEAITYDENVKYGWAKIPHFVMQDTYYLYQYSIGMAIAVDIAYRILSNEKDIVKKYKEFLSLGNSVSIEEALRYLDIDLKNGNYIENAIKVLKDKIEVMANLSN